MRRRRDQSGEPSAPPDASNAIAITLREVVALVETFEYAHAQIAMRSDADDHTVAKASGSHLIPALYARAGFAAGRESDRIPLLVSELGSLEAAVLNLESYGGHEAELCLGYGMLDSLGNREAGAGLLRSVHGILAFADEAADPVQDVSV
ncbi:hypothetical protein V1460_13370 [Streptomyces sp. SCSIO 30461]|uniref:hypothetical protein n=1 Tax=Streptomyces sp. SCSIO 30461 TaxID=3118085 RepID=UPI0030D22DD0